MRKICVVTGSRAEYGLLRPVMRAIERSHALSLQLIVTGMHLATRDGGTLSEIKRDGLEPSDSVPLTPQGDTVADTGRAVGWGIVEFVNSIEDLAPDIVLLLGDRIEAFAAAIAAAFLRKCVAHIQGGDRTRAGFDESMRHAITKLAHVHFAATERSAERIRRMGERAEHVHVVGAPGLDEALAGPFVERDELAGRLGVDLSKPPIVVVQHPLSTRPDDAEGDMTETMEAGAGFHRELIVVYPNNDAGGRRMIEVIRHFEGRRNVHGFANLAHTGFLSLLRCAGVLVGNSSSGIIEAASFRLPVVNVGERQAGRERAANVLDVPPERGQITAAITKALEDRDFRASLEKLENPYGDGQASGHIVEVLENVTINHELIQKQIAY